MIDNRKTFTRAIEEPNLIIYTSFEESKMAVVSEVPCVVGLYPDEFKHFILNWPECAKLCNPILLEIIQLEPVQGYAVAKTVGDAPWPISKRISYSCRYPHLDYKPNEHVLILSERGSETQINFTEQDAKDFALAKLFIAGWYFGPVLDSEGNLVGTKIFNLSSADAGGSIP